MFDFQDVLDALAQSSSSSSSPEPAVASKEEPSPTCSQNKSTDIANPAVQMSDEPRFDGLTHSAPPPVEHLELPQPHPAPGLQSSQSYNQTVLTHVGTESGQMSQFNNVIPSAQLASEFQRPQPAPGLQPSQSYSQTVLTHVGTESGQMSQFNNVIPSAQLASEFQQPQPVPGLQDGPSQNCSQTLSTNFENDFLQEQYGLRFDGVVDHQPHSSEFSGFFEFPHLQPPVGLLSSPMQSCSQTVLTDIGSNSVHMSEEPHLAGFNGLIDSQPLPFEFPHQPAPGLRESPSESYSQTMPTDVGNGFLQMAEEQYGARLDGVVDHEPLPHGFSEFPHLQQPAGILSDPTQSCSQTVLTDVGSTSVQMSQSQQAAGNGLNPSPTLSFDFDLDDIFDSGIHIFYFSG